MIRGRLVGVLVAGTLVASGGVIAGCGSSDDGGGSANVEVLQQAATATAKQQSFHMKLSIDQAIAGQKFRIDSEGDYANGRGRMTLDFGNLAKQFGAAPGVGDVLESVGGASALKATMLTDKTTLLLSLPAMQKALKLYAKKDVPEWASLDAKQLGDTLGIDIGSLLAGSTGSEQTVAYLRALTGDLDEVGKETIDGVPTTHYRGTLDFADLPEGALPAAMEKSMKQLADVLKKSGASTKSPVDVWVDGDDLVRRQVVVQKIQGSTSTTRVDFSDYGKAVSIDLPPAAERFDALALIDELAPGALQAGAQALKGGGLTP